MLPVIIGAGASSLYSSYMYGDLYKEQPVASQAAEARLERKEYPALRSQSRLDLIWRNENMENELLATKTEAAMWQMFYLRARIREMADSPMYSDDDREKAKKDAEKAKVSKLSSIIFLKRMAHDVV